MNKTDDEIKNAVLAECERLAPEPYPSRGHFTKTHYVVQWYDHSGFSLVSTTASHGGLNINLPKDAKASSDVWLLAYRILGLEARDAVESERARHAMFDARMALMDAKQGKYLGMYRDSEARSAKLVEALENIATWYECTHAESRRIAQLALAEWRGGQQP